jgi:dephospho-CoA kinase
MTKIGLTGGIGSGKSIVARVFRVLGVPVYNSDERAKALYVESGEVQRAVIDLLGDNAYHSDGKLNRDYVGQRVFSDREMLEKLNKIIHPAVGRDFQAWVDQQESPYIIKEAAILFESGANRGVDKVLAVMAPDDIRIQRVMQRDGVSESEVRRRMANQMNQDELVKRSDFVIVNDNRRLIVPQILKIHENIIHT